MPSREQTSGVRQHEDEADVGICFLITYARYAPFPERPSAALEKGAKDLSPDAQPVRLSVFLQNPQCCLSKFAEIPLAGTFFLKRFGRLPIERIAFIQSGVGTDFGMTWKPRHEAHAIERVRILFPFKDPLTTKILRQASAEVVEQADGFGFDSVTPAESSFANFNIPVLGNLGNLHSPQKVPGKMNGTVLRRHLDGTVVEEVGFRDGVFGYLTTTYGRWENLLGRLREIVLKTLYNVENAVDLDSLKLEYWDTFTFDGVLTDADAKQLLAQVDNSVPTSVVGGSSQWHSHIGWFEGIGEHQILINRNIDVVDREGTHGSLRNLGVYTMVEMRGGDDGLRIIGIEDALEMLHRRSLRLFGETLSEEYREMIGLNLDRYQ